MKNGLVHFLILTGKEWNKYLSQIMVGCDGCLDKEMKDKSRC